MISLTFAKSIEIAMEWGRGGAAGRATGASYPHGKQVQNGAVGSNPIFSLTLIWEKFVYFPYIACRP